jgi:hypothetical protein
MDGRALGQRHNEENSSPSDLLGAFYDKSITYTKAQSLTRRRNDLRRIADFRLLIADFQIANRKSTIRSFGFQQHAGHVIMLRRVADEGVEVEHQTF